MFTPDEIKIMEDVRTVKDPPKWVCTQLFKFKNRILKAKGEPEMKARDMPCYCNIGERVQHRDWFFKLYDQWKTDGDNA